jgi:hypothetical protein
MQSPLGVIILKCDFTGVLNIIFNVYSHEIAILSLLQTYIV